MLAQGSRPSARAGSSSTYAGQHGCETRSSALPASSSRTAASCGSAPSSTSSTSPNSASRRGATARPSERPLPRRVGAGGLPSPRRRVSRTSRRRGADLAAVGLSPLPVPNGSHLRRRGRRAVRAPHGRRTATGENTSVPTFCTRAGPGRRCRRRDGIARGGVRTVPTLAARATGARGRASLEQLKSSA
jgi:hypothetical protein